VSALLDLLDVRPMNDHDRNFVRSSWLRSNRARCEWAPRSEYFRLHHDVVEGLLERSTTLVACAKENPTQIVGWACGEITDGHPILHFAYVKRPFRNQGVAGHLVETLCGRRDGIVLTHQPAPSVSERVRALRWAVRPTLAFYLGLEASEVPA